MSLGGLNVTDEDIIAFDGAGFSLAFDGSEHGLSSYAIDGFAMVEGGILFSFETWGTLPGWSGTFDESDVVRFDTASGEWEQFFDGSDVGLESNGENVDALELLPDGRLLVSVNNLFGVPGVTGNDEDVIAFTFAGAPGWSTSGSWEMYFDGADVGFNYSIEDVDSLAVREGTLYASTIGNFSASGVSGADEDVVACENVTTGWSTACNPMSMFFNGSDWGIGGNDIAAIDFP